ILQRNATIPVIEAQDQMGVQPDHVYVIPPNRDLTIVHGRLQVTVPTQPHGQRMPIDGFLRSLSEDQADRAIGIILSGTGTDGTLGLRAILGAGGISLVQDPDTAKYEGMPSSAIKAGYATHVLPVEKMPEVLLSGSRIQTIQLERQLPPTATSGINRILMLLRANTGHDFSQYKKSTIGRRIERRMSMHEIDDTEVYARYLKEHPAEIHVLFKELLINVTSFFRDPEAFDMLKQQIVPLLMENKPEDYVLRVWVAGGATGEEAYSIAMLLREFMDDNQHEFKTQIYSTDLDEDAIAIARGGIYPPNISQDVPQERLRRFFIKEESGYRIKKEIREMVVFATQSVIKDPPFTKLDLLCCRNLMIYLEPELQNRLIPTFHYALKPHGVLFLSPSESIGNHTELFTPLDRKWKFYRAIGTVTTTRTVMSTPTSWITQTHTKAPEEMTTQIKATNYAELTKRALLQSYAPASVVTDKDGNILYVHGDTGKYLRPAPGQATLNIVDMAREGLQLELRAALNNAGKNYPTLNREVSIRNNEDMQSVSFSLRQLPDSGSNEKLLLISFQDVLRPASEKEGKDAVSANSESRRIVELERELALAREHLQATIEGQQASSEELQSTNEELQSTNEELQSTNEELETSKEELQSVNEELITVNAELQFKIEQLVAMQNDMKNLLDNINIGAMFLDAHMVIRRFTREATRVFRLVASDVGRPLADIKSNLENDDMLADAQAVLDTLIPREREVQAIDGTSFLARIQPYRTLDNVIEGVVLSFAETTELVRVNADRQDALKLTEGIVDTVREPLVVLDSDLRVSYASHSFYQIFQTTPDQTLHRPIYELGNRQWNIPKLRDLLETILPRDQSFEDYVVEGDFPAIGHSRFTLNARRIIGQAKNSPLILLAMEIDA
ncbi:MAG TPA: CheR family methyltransferase, partial [Gallionella sp.]|nr:CheR family methyltransferase [Gallionella sp.]